MHQVDRASHPLDRLVWEQEAEEELHIIQPRPQPGESQPEREVWILMSKTDW